MSSFHGCEVSATHYGTVTVHPDISMGPGKLVETSKRTLEKLYSTVN